MAAPEGGDLLREELETYDKSKEKLLKEDVGKFVLIKGHEIVGIFDTEDEALTEGYKRFSGESFLVKQILPEEPFLNFTSNMIRPPHF